MRDYCFLVGLQVVLESFPISSTGHLVLIDRLSRYWQQAGFIFFLKTQEFGTLEHLLHVFHIPSLIIICFFFRDRLALCYKSPRRMSFKVLKLILFSITADSITALFFLLKKSYGYSLPLGIGFIVTACMLFSLRWCAPGVRKSLSFFMVCALGVVQAFALFPGVSRLATVFVAARWLGFNNSRAFEVSWVLQIPLIIGGSIVGLTALWMEYASFDLVFACCNWLLLLSMFGGYAGMYIVWRLACANKLWLLSWYMIIPSLLAFLL